LRAWNESQPVVFPHCQQGRELAAEHKRKGLREILEEVGILGRRVLKVSEFHSERAVVRGGRQDEIHPYLEGAFRKCAGVVQIGRSRSITDGTLVDPQSQNRDDDGNRDRHHGSSRKRKAYGCGTEPGPQESSAHVSCGQRTQENRVRQQAGSGSRGRNQSTMEGLRLRANADDERQERGGYPGREYGRCRSLECRESVCQPCDPTDDHDHIDYRLVHEANRGKNCNDHEGYQQLARDKRRRSQWPQVPHQAERAHQKRTDKEGNEQIPLIGGEHACDHPNRERHSTEQRDTNAAAHHVFRSRQERKMSAETSSRRCNDDRRRQAGDKGDHERADHGGEVRQVRAVKRKRRSMIKSRLHMPRAAPCELQCKSCFESRKHQGSQKTGVAAAMLSDVLVGAQVKGDERPLCGVNARAGT